MFIGDGLCYIYRQGSAEYFWGSEFQRFVLVWVLVIGAVFLLVDNYGVAQKSTPV